MPHQPVEDSDFSEDEIPAQRGIPAIPQDQIVGHQQESEGEEEGSEELAEDQCIVEKILDHKFDRDGVLYFHIKWERLTSRHNTWEPEENVVTASERLEEYFEEIGGRPTHTPMSKKRKFAKSRSQLSQKVQTELPHSLGSIDLDPSDRSEKLESLRRSGPISPALASGSKPHKTKDKQKPAGNRASGTKMSESNRLSEQFREEEEETAARRNRPETIVVLDSSDEDAKPLVSPFVEKSVSRKSVKSLSMFATLSGDDTISERPMKRRHKKSQSSSRSWSARKKNNGQNHSEALGHADNLEEYVSDNNQSDSRDDWDEHDIEYVNNIEQVDGERINVFLIRKDGRQITVSKEDAYKKCPQQMLLFYESNLSFNR